MRDDITSKVELEVLDPEDIEDDAAEDAPEAPAVYVADDEIYKVRGTVSDVGVNRFTLDVNGELKFTFEFRAEDSAWMDPLSESMALSDNSDDSDDTDLVKASVLASKAFKAMLGKEGVRSLTTYYKGKFGYMPSPVIVRVGGAVLEFLPKAKKV